MPDYPRKQRVLVTLSHGSGQKHYRLPGQHPEVLDETGIARAAPPKPGVVVHVGKEAEIEVVDARHEEVLRWDKHVKFIDAPPAPESPAAPVDAPPAPDAPAPDAPVDAPPPAKGKKR